MNGIDVDTFFGQQPQAPSRSRTRVSLLSLLGEAVGVCRELTLRQAVQATGPSSVPKDNSMSMHAFQHARQDIEALIKDFKVDAQVLPLPSIPKPQEHSKRIDTICAPLIRHNDTQQRPSSVEKKSRMKDQSALVVGMRTERAREGVNLAETASHEITPILASRFRTAMRLDHSNEWNTVQKQWFAALFTLKSSELFEQILQIWTDAILFGYSADNLALVSAHHDAFINWLNMRWAKVVEKRSSLKLN